MESKQIPKSDNLVTPRRGLRYLISLIGLGLAVHLILPQLTTLEHSYRVIRGMIIWPVALAITAQVLSYLGIGYLLKSLVDMSGGSLSIQTGTVITIAGTSFGMVAGGMIGSSAVIYRWMQNEEVKPEVAALAGTIPVLFINILLFFASMVGLIHLLAVHQLSRLQGVSFAIILVLMLTLLGFLIWGLRKRETLTSYSYRFDRWWAAFRKQERQTPKAEKWLARFFKAGDLILAGGWRGSIFGTAIFVSFDILSLYLLFIAAGYRISFGVLLTGYGLPLLLGRMAFMVPGGVGVIESAMAGIYTSLGIPNAEVVVVVLTYRVLSFWLPLLIGFPLILFLERKSSQNNSPIPSE